MIDDPIKGLSRVLVHCHKLYNKYEEDQQALAEMNQAAKDAIEFIKTQSKELEFEKGFNGTLCEAIAEKRKVRITEVKKDDLTDGWILCRDRLPKSGEEVVLFFRDTFHTHPSWPKTQVLCAWRCNVNENKTPNGEWAIEGRCWNNVVISLEDGIAWMPLPGRPNVEE